MPQKGRSFIRGTEYRHSNHVPYCDNGWSVHSWKIKTLTLEIDKNQPRRYRVCTHCNEIRAMGVNTKKTMLFNIHKPIGQSCQPYQPMDDLDELDTVIYKRHPIDLWSIILKRVMGKINPIEIKDEDKVQTRVGVDICKCHGRYINSCPFKGKQEPNKPLLTQEMKQSIKPLEKPWCDIPLPLGPKKQLMTCKEFYERWNYHHGKAQTYLEYWAIHKKLPPGSTDTETPKFLMDDPNDVLEGPFIQLSLG